jgi:hypothetical protein
VQRNTRSDPRARPLLAPWYGLCTCTALHCTALHCFAGGLRTVLYCTYGAAWPCWSDLVSLPASPPLPLSMNGRVTRDRQEEGRERGRAAHKASHRGSVSPVFSAYGGGVRAVSPRGQLSPSTTTGTCIIWPCNIGRQTLHLAPLCKLYAAQEPRDNHSRAETIPSNDHS